MALLTINAGLSAYKGPTGSVSADEFLSPLKTREDSRVVDAVADRAAGMTALVVLIDLNAESFSDAAAPADEMESAVNVALVRFAEWLNERPPAVFHSLSRQGIRCRAFFELWIDQDQFDLVLPLELVGALAARGISVELNSNP